MQYAARRVAATSPRLIIVTPPFFDRLWLA
jgi:hypothetical protein